MINVFDKFTAKKREFIVKEANLIEIMKMINSSASISHLKDVMSVGNCGWDKEPDSWFILAELTDKQWSALLRECKSKKYQLIIKDVPGRMYFTKVKGS